MKDLGPLRCTSLKAMKNSGLLCVFSEIICHLQACNKREKERLWQRKVMPNSIPALKAYLTSIFKSNGSFSRKIKKSFCTFPFLNNCQPLSLMIYTGVKFCISSWSVIPFSNFLARKCNSSFSLQTLSQFLSQKEAQIWTKKNHFFT